MDSPKEDQQNTTHKPEEHQDYFVKPTSKHPEEQGGQSFLSGSTADTAASFLSRTNESFSITGYHNQTDVPFFQADFPEKMEIEEVPVEKLSRKEAREELDRLRTSSTHNIYKTNQRIKEIVKVFPRIEEDEKEENEDNSGDFETLFHLEIRNGELCVDARHYDKNLTKPGLLDRFENEKKVWIKIPFLYLEDDDIITQFRHIFSHLKQIEEVKLDFVGLRENEIYEEQIQSHLEGLMSTVFKEKDGSKRIPYRKIQVNWDWHQDGGSFLMSFLSSKFNVLSNTLEEVQISMKKILSEDIFKEFLLGLQNVEQNLTTFDLETYLKSPEDRPYGKHLKLPKVTKCSLRLTCYGKSSSSLIDFIRGSLETMTSIQDLSIELIMDKLSKEDVTRLFETVKGLSSPNLENLEIMLWYYPDKQLKKQHYVNELVDLAKEKLDIKKFKNLTIGLDSQNFKSLEEF